MKTATIFLHASKEANFSVGSSIGLSGPALDRFCYAGYEVQLGLNVDDGGNATIVTVDGRRVERDKPKPETTDASQSPGAALIAEERARQISEEGYGAGHDDAHRLGEIAWAAAWYAAPECTFKMSMNTEPGGVSHAHFDGCWPWERQSNRKALHSRIRQLAIAGALCAAEIDRLMRINSAVQS